MKFLAKLRMRSCVKLLIPVAILCFFALLMFMLSGVTDEPPEIYDLHDVPVTDLEGKWVTFDVTFIYGCYGYTEQTKDGHSTGEILSQSYLIDLNDEYMVSLTLSGEDMTKADALLEECLAVIQGESAQITKTVSFLGRAEYLREEKFSALRDAIGYDTLDPEVQSSILRLDFCSDTIDSPNYLLLVVSILLVAFAVVLEIMGASGFFQKTLVKKANELTYGEPAQLYAYLHERLKNKDGIRGVYVNGNLLFLCTFAGHRLYDQQDLVWAYQKNVTKKFYGIVSMGVTSSVVLRMANGKTFEFQMSDAEVKYILKELWEQFPLCVQGYSQQIEQISKKSPELLKEIAKLQHGTTQQ